MFISAILALMITSAIAYVRYDTFNSGFFWDAYNDEECKENRAKFWRNIISGVFLYSLQWVFLFAFILFITSLNS